MKKFFIPPKSVAEAAKLGLAFRKYFKRGGTLVGIKRAHQLMNREHVSLATIKRMNKFFIRHFKNRKTPPEEGNGQIAWLLWGGDPGKR